MRQRCEAQDATIAQLREELRKAELAAQEVSISKECSEGGMLPNSEDGVRKFPLLPTFFR